MSSDGAAAASSSSAAAGPDPVLAAAFSSAARAAPHVAAAADEEIDAGLEAVLGDKYVPWSALVLGDSWFGSVKAAVAHGVNKVHFIGNVKTSHGGSPKKEIEEALKGRSGGSRVALTIEIEGVKLVAVGYKYNSSKVIFFIMTEGAGALTNGSTYSAKFQDGVGNVITRPVDRQIMASRYYSYSPAVDQNNQARQDELKLEELWQTQECWFRLFCTIIGITTTDAYFGVRSTVHSAHPMRNMRMDEFADQLAYQLVHNNKSDGGGAHGRGQERRGSAAATAAAATAASSLLSASTPSGNEHILAPFGRKTTERGTPYSIQHRCHVCNNKTSKFCTAPQCSDIQGTSENGGKNFGCCPNNSGSGKRGYRNCLQVHQERMREMARTESPILYPPTAAAAAAAQSGGKRGPPATGGAEVGGAKRQR